MRRRDFIGKSFFAIPFFTTGVEVKGSVKALFVTDMHLSPEIGKSGAAADYLINYLNKNPGIDFVINGGDSVYDVAKLKYPNGEEQWKFFKSFRERIKIPVFNCLGNHDIYEWELSKDPIADPSSRKVAALKHLDMERSYYSFKMGRWKFIVLDSLAYVLKGYKGMLGGKQLEWFVNELKKDRDYRLAVVSHIPVISACEALYLTAEKNYLYPKMAARLSHSDAPAIFEAIKDTKVELFLHGHLHMQESIRYKDSFVYNGGAFSGDLWRGSFHGFKNCFTILDFPDSGLVQMKRVDLPDEIA